MIEAIKKKYPIRDEDDNPSTYPTFADQVFMEDGTAVSEEIQNLKKLVEGKPNANGVSF